MSHCTSSSTVSQKLQLPTTNTIRDVAQETVMFIKLSLDFILDEDLSERCRGSHAPRSDRLKSAVQHLTCSSKPTNLKLASLITIVSIKASWLDSHDCSDDGTNSIVTVLTQCFSPCLLAMLSAVTLTRSELQSVWLGIESELTLAR